MIKEITIPLVTVSESNMHQNWIIAHKRHKNQKIIIGFELALNHRIAKDLPVIITMTRLSPRLLDDDNLQSSFKYIRDAIAEHFIEGKAAGRADDDPRFIWKYGQMKSKERGVKLTFDWTSS